MSTAERIYQEVQRMPESLAREVLDFVQFLEVRHGLRTEMDQNLKEAQRVSMNKVWDNAEDEAWNDL